jgi:hypothetical protein
MRKRENTSTRLSIPKSRMFLEQGQWKECGRRTPRAEVEPEIHHVWVSLSGISLTPMVVTTIAELGCFCPVKDCEKLKLAQDQAVDVTLIIENKQFEFEGRVCLIEKGGFSLEFYGPPEEARQMIRKVLRPEFLARSLSPYLSYATMEPGANGTLIYSDGDLNSLQISLFDGKILAVHFDLDVLNLRLVWRKTDMRKSGVFTGEFTDTGNPRRILSFIRHLQGLSREMYGEIESIIIAGKTL